MKRFLLIALALISVSLSSVATQKSYDNLGNFHGIKVQGAFGVNIIQSNEKSVVANIDDALIDYVRVEVINNILVISIDNVPFKYSTKAKKENLQFTIKTPIINNINISGSADLTFTGQFDLGMNRFALGCTGASKIRGLNIKTNSLESSISGVSNIDMTCDVVDFEMECSGASKMNINGNITDIELDVSGASKITLSGAANHFDVDCSGASAISALNFKCDNINADCSGASKLDIYVVKSLDIEVSGASKCSYKSDGNILMQSEVNGASSLKKYQAQ